MNDTYCRYEDELLDALGRGFVDAELEAHAMQCGRCGELRLVAGALLDDRSAAMLAAPIPAAGTMWWRIQLRRRHDAAATARRSLLIGQLATVLVAIGLLLTFFGPSLAIELRNTVTFIRTSTPLLIAVSIWMVATPIAGWAMLRQK